MTKLAALVLLLAACSKEDYKNQTLPEEEAPAVAPAEKKPPPPPPKKELSPEELGKCELKASGAVDIEQTSRGGRAATNVSYWFTEAERNNMMGVDGFVMNCHGKDIKFSILPGGGKNDGLPFGPKKYEFKKGTGDANVMVTFGHLFLCLQPPQGAAVAGKALRARASALQIQRKGGGSR